MAPDPVRERNSRSPSPSCENEENDFSPVRTPTKEGHKGRKLSQSLGEGSHLLSPEQPQDDEIYSGEGLHADLEYLSNKEESKSLFYLFLLTLSIGG